MAKGGAEKEPKINNFSSAILFFIKLTDES